MRLTLLGAGSCGSMAPLVRAIETRGSSTRRLGCRYLLRRPFDQDAVHRLSEIARVERVESAQDETRAVCGGGPEGQYVADVERPGDSRRAPAVSPKK